MVSRDFRRRKFLFHHFQPGQEADIVNHAGVAGFSRGQMQDAILDFQRKNAVTLDKIRRQRAERIRGGGKLGGSPWRFGNRFQLLNFWRKICIHFLPGLFPIATPISRDP